MEKKVRGIHEYFIFVCRKFIFDIDLQWVIDRLFFHCKEERKNSKNNSSIHFEYIVMQGLDSDEDATHCQE